MRPVERGEIPQDDAGNPKVYARYQEARADLIGRLGDYCSYCGVRLPAALAIEHVQPKSLRPAFETSWGNFLLACANCNSIKGHHDVHLDAYFWPDVDNTLRVIRYLAEGIVQPHEALSPELRDRATRTIELTGLDRTPDRDPEASDRRWLDRREAWTMAAHARQRFDANPIDALRDQIIDTALAKGHWSIWFTLFDGLPDILIRLARECTGTALDCFDEQMQLVPRTGGAV
jgi:uncharacterized protein (TIGR02646 family)